MSEQKTAVRIMLAEAGVPASESESVAFARHYGALRAGVDALYAVVEARAVEPALRFHPSVGPHVEWSD